MTVRLVLRSFHGAVRGARYDLHAGTYVDIDDRVVDLIENELPNAFGNPGDEKKIGAADKAALNTTDGHLFWHDATGFVTPLGAFGTKDAPITAPPYPESPTERLAREADEAANDAAVAAKKAAKKGEPVAGSVTQGYVNLNTGAPATGTTQAVDLGVGNAPADIANTPAVAPTPNPPKAGA